MNSEALSWALARANSAGLHALSQGSDFAGDDLGETSGVFGGATGIDAQHADVGVGVGVGVDGVGQSQTLAGLLEQARGHAAAEDFGEQPQGPMVGVEHARGGQQEDHMRLFQGSALDRDAAGEGAGGRRRGTRGIGGAEALLGQGQQLVLVHRAGGADHQAVGGVEPGAPVRQGLGRHVGQGCRGTQDRGGPGADP